MLKHLAIATLYYLILGSIELLGLYSNIQPAIKAYDVGQGDALVLITEKGEKVLVDGGPSFDLDYKLLSDFPSMDFCPIDVVVLTHPHADHLQGLYRYVLRCSPNYIVFDNAIYDSKLYFDFKNEVERHVMENTSVHLTSNQFKSNLLGIEVLWPPENFDFRRVDNINNVSIVLFYNSKAATPALLLGDLEKDSQSLMLREILFENEGNEIPFNYNRFSGTSSKQSAVLKLAHHGAENGLNRQLFNIFSPSECLISVGEKNSYGHPSSITLKYAEKLL